MMKEPVLRSKTRQVGWQQTERIFQISAEEEDRDGSKVSVKTKRALHQENGHLLHMGDDRHLLKKVSFNWLRYDDKCLCWIVR